MQFLWCFFRSLHEFQGWTPRLWWWGKTNTVHLLLFLNNPAVFCGWTPLCFFFLGSPLDVLMFAKINRRLKPWFLTMRILNETPTSGYPPCPVGWSALRKHIKKNLFWQLQRYWFPINVTCLHKIFLDNIHNFASVSMVLYTIWFNFYMQCKPWKHGPSSLPFNNQRVIHSLWCTQTAPFSCCFQSPMFWWWNPKVNPLKVTYIYKNIM